MLNTNIYLELGLELWLNYKSENFEISLCLWENSFFYSEKVGEWFEQGKWEDSKDPDPAREYHTTVWGPERQGGNLYSAVSSLFLHRF